MKTANLVKPEAMSSLSTWLHYLEQIHPTTIELGLERVNTVATTLNLLKPAPYIFTVAGTNGKGTTCRTLEMILLAAGFRVGVYSSPHLLHYTERVRINNQELPEALHVQAFHEIETQRGQTSLTYFEYSTLAALWLFQQANLDVVILEVGLGGRLDATNIVQQNVSVITSIALDHTDYLGHDRNSIGREKAGIFKPNNIVIIGEPNAPDSIYDVAKQNNINALHLCEPNKNGDWHYRLNDDNNSWEFYAKNHHYSALPIPQVPLMNAATALAALSYSELTVSHKAITSKAIVSGLENAALVGRFQVLQTHPTVIIDVAHNPHAASYLHSKLTQYIKQHQITGKVRFVIGMLKDKDIVSTVQQLNGDVWYCGSLGGDRGAKASVIAAAIDNKNSPVFCFDSITQAWQKALADSSNHDIIVVCGSFLTVSEIIDLAKGT